MCLHAHVCVRACLRVRQLLLHLCFQQVSLQRLKEIFEADPSLYHNVVIVSFNLDFLLRVCNSSLICACCI